MATGLRTAPVPTIAETRIQATPTATDTPPTGEEDGPAVWQDEAAESEYRAEARDRGEVVTAPKPKEEAADDADAKPLPALDELVQRIPADVRETLEDLFRARFVTVKRVPKRALKT